jgi:hypothetical protein
MSLPLRLSPAVRRRMTPGRSVTRNPRRAAPTSSSAAWNWGWCNGTSAGTSERIARSPKDGSVMRWPVTTRMRAA